jgi:hypothetical protein
MRSPARLTRLLTLLLILVFACQPEEGEILQDDPDRLEIEEFISDAEEVLLHNPSARIAQETDPCGESQEIQMMAYRYKNVGAVTINNLDDFLTVKYNTLEGFSLHRTYLVLMIENQDPDPDTRFYSNYRKIILPVEHSSSTMEYLYEIPMADFNLTSGDCLSVIAFAILNTHGDSNHYRKTFAVAKQEDNNTRSIFKRYFIDYCLQECNAEKPVDDEPCIVNCSYAFGSPSVDVANSVSFEDLGIIDWSWGYAHEITNETLVRLPIMKDDIEGAEIQGQVTVMIENNIAYVYFQMNDGYPMNKVSLYFSSTKPESGVPCSYTYNTEFTNPDGTWAPTLNYMYTITDLSQLLGTTADDENKLNPIWIIAYTDFCN